MPFSTTPQEMNAVERMPAQGSLALAAQAMAGQGIDRAGEIVGRGDLIPLPILEALDGGPMDLMELADDRPVVLIFTGDDGGQAGAAALRAWGAALSRIEAAGALLVVVTPGRPGWRLAPSFAARAAVAVDRSERFAGSLGLAAVPGRSAGEGRGLAAAYVLAPCGRVIWSEVASDARAIGPETAVAALGRLAARPAERSRADEQTLWGRL